MLPTRTCELFSAAEACEECTTQILIQKNLVVVIQDNLRVSGDTHTVYNRLPSVAVIGQLHHKQRNMKIEMNQK